MNTTRYIRYFAAFPLLAIAAGIGYYACAVYSARQYTINDILPQTRSSVYALQVSDLTPRQLDILLKVEDPNFFNHHGVDFTTPGAGITTITQGLANSFTSSTSSRALQNSGKVS